MATKTKKRSARLDALLPPEENPKETDGEKPAEKDKDGGLDPKWKIAAWVAGGAVILFGTAVAVSRFEKSSKKPKRVSVGLMVKPMCAGYTITDPLKLRNTLRKEIETAITRKESVEPFSLTSRFLSQKRFSCPVYPNPSTPAAAELYYTIFGIVTELMVQDGLAADLQRRTFDNMAMQWAQTQGAFPEELILEDENEAGGAQA